MATLETVGSTLDPILKLIQIVVVPGLYLFYKEVKEIAEHLSNMKLEIAKLAPLDRFTDLTNRVTIIETKLQVTLDRIESDLNDIKESIK